MEWVKRWVVLGVAFFLLFAVGCGDTASGTGGAGGLGASGGSGTGGIGGDAGGGGLGSGSGGTGGTTNALVHTIELVNNCDEQIWIGSNAESPSAAEDWALAPRCTEDDACGAGQTCEDSACTCDSDSDCVFRSTADTTAKCDPTTSKCVSTATVTVGGGWSGRFWARTQCSGSDTEFICKTGQCGPETGGDIDCAASSSTANQATLFEVTTAGASGIDNFDVSLVSGYNVPVVVTVELPPDHAQWQANTTFDAGAQIVEMVGEDTFGFTQSSATGMSGGAMPMFPGTWRATVMDGALTWENVGPQCQRSGCEADLNKTCPSELQVLDDMRVIGCDAPANACVSDKEPCNAELDYYQCQNNGGPKDLFGNVLDLQSPNAETYVCFSKDDCPAGTACTLNPKFDSGFTMPTDTGLCLPVTQNGGCQPGDDGKRCPLRTYPFVDYHCQTLSDEESDAQVCIPPKVTGFGDLWWNEANWAQVTPDKSCREDGDCGVTNEKCLATPVLGGVKQCPEGDTGCVCYKPNPCSSARGTNSGCPDPKQCLNSTGQVDGIDADCSTETCYCGPQGIFSGPCGPMNPSWNAAAASVGNWPTVFKTACPVAYSYQYDDPSSNWSCPNPSGALVGYKVDFCLVPEAL